ncbi:MAG: DNA polymerase III subunit alpha [Planctomycetes bacterium RBG_16_55_9]|nr:MAG: DNA polymerase III subunit alpha [Planctomycetes bacterium RBG_16_55_9]
MRKPQLTYFEKEDVLHLVVSEGPEAQSVELSPNITVELNDKGELIGIEILKASSFLRDTIMESVQAKLLSVGSGDSE